MNVSSSDNEVDEDDNDVESVTEVADEDEEESSSSSESLLMSVNSSSAIYPSNLGCFGGRGSGVRGVTPSHSSHNLLRAVFSPLANNFRATLINAARSGAAGVAHAIG